MSTTPTLNRSEIDRHGEPIATVEDYADAQRIVDELSDRSFPVEHVAIVGRDLRFVEHVIGRRRYGRAAMEGAGSGAVTGLIVGVLLSLFTLWEPVVAAFVVWLWWALIGAVAGAVLGVVGHALRRGRRDFSSVGATEAARFDVTVRSEHAREARRILEGARTAA